jgi:hypothetical protein
VSQPTSADAFACLKAQNLRYAVVRCYESVGRPDPNCAQTVRNAHAGGMEQVLSTLPARARRRPALTRVRMQVDAYMFPCPQCGPAAAQVQSLVNYWEANGVNVTLLWLDIEGSQYWLGNAGRNQASSPALCLQLNPTVRNPLTSGACRRGTPSSTMPAHL